MEKECRQCGIVLPIDKFPTIKKTYKGGTCHSCRKRGIAFWADHKKCKGCRKIFTLGSINQDGFCNRCEEFGQNPEAVVFKQCPECQNELPLLVFPSDGKGGKRGICKPCYKMPEDQRTSRHCYSCRKSVSKAEFKDEQSNTCNDCYPKTQARKDGKRIRVAKVAQPLKPKMPRVIKEHRPTAPRGRPKRVDNLLEEYEFAKGFLGFNESRAIEWIMERYDISHQTVIRRIKSGLQHDTKDVQDL